MNKVYILNNQKNISVIQMASFGSSPGVANESDPIVFCFSDQYLVYHDAQFEGEPPLVNLRATLKAHIDANLIESNAMNLLG